MEGAGWVDVWRRGPALILLFSRAVCVGDGKWNLRGLMAGFAGSL